MGELKALLLAFLVERALDVETWVWATGACAGVPEKEEIHSRSHFRTVVEVEA